MDGCKSLRLAGGSAIAREDKAMETKHTPGKWQIEYGFIKQERKDGQKVVRIVAPHPEGGGQDIAECIECNAQLFAAAPDLLDALTDLVGGCGKEGDLFSGEAMQKAREAIAKAEGRAL